MSRNGVDIAALAIMLVGLAARVSAEELRAQDEADCRSFGFQPGTPDLPLVSNARAWQDGTVLLLRPDGTGRAGGVRGGRRDRSGSGPEELRIGG
jgi:hypothetical protein